MKIFSQTMSSVAEITVLLFLFAGAGFCEEKPLSFTNDDIDKYRSPSDNRPQEQRKTSTPVKKDQLSFTNDDIDKYHSPSDNRPQEQRKTSTSVKKDQHKKAQGNKEQEYWCKRATIAKRKIENADRDVREREEDISREQSRSVHTSRKMNTLQGKLKKAKDHLSFAEQDLTDIEHEAHRKSIPPGWLRCQFE